MQAQIQNKQLDETQHNQSTYNRNSNVLSPNHFRCRNKIRIK